MDTLLWSTSKGHIYKGEIPIGNLNNPRTFAYDWIGNVLYWAPTRSLDTVSYNHFRCFYSFYIKLLWKYSMSLSL